MQLYRFHEASVLLPDGAQDQTVNILAFAGSRQITVRGVPAPDFSVVVSRQEVNFTETIQTIADRQIRELEQSLAGFALLLRRDIYLDGADAVEVEFTWKSEQGQMRQRQAYILCPSSVSLKPTVRTALTITGTTQESLALRYEAAFQNLISSLKFDR